jgi:tetratricopeptide (TPR) repeat protein
MAHNNLGVVLRRQQRNAEALEAFTTAVRLAPRNADALNNLGVVLHQLGRPDEAIARFEQAIAVRPGLPSALTNWGNVLKDRDDLEGAARLYERALASEPDFADALNNRANVALDAGDFEAAERGYRRAVAANPAFVDPRFSLAQIALHRRDFAVGWADYELRFRTTGPMATWNAPALPRYEARDAGRGLRVAVWREQGVGDQLLFATLLPALAATGARPVVEVDERLLPLFRRRHPDLAFVGPAEAPEAFRHCDRHLPLGSLPALLRPDLASFQGQPRAILQADPERVRAAREALGPGRWVAVSWKSLQMHGRSYLARRKSMPVKALGLLAEVPGLRLLDVQYGDVEEDRRAFDALHPGFLHRLAGLDVFNDFDGVCAALSACEAVVTTSNVTAHLAGGLGVPAWILFPGPRAPFPYWSGNPGEASLWYPSVTIASHPTQPGWEPMVAAVAARLAAGPVR